MKWKHPEEDDERVVWRTAFFWPLCVGGECRLFGVYRVVQRYVYVPFFNTRRLEWVNVVFADSAE